MSKTIEEINDRIRRGEAVVVNAEEIIGIAREKGIKKAAQEVDVVTTGTFGPMCSSAAYFNIGHSNPRIKLGGGKAILTMNNAYAELGGNRYTYRRNALPMMTTRNRIIPEIQLRPGDM
jgi:uncharacterized protein (DUF39 family)